jgi:hypothetical protein
MRWTAVVTRAMGWALSTVWAAARRRPALAIVVGVALIILWPLAVDLLFVIPPPLRKAGGWVLVAGLVLACLARLWRIEPGDLAPPADQHAAFSWTCLIPLLICAVMAVPYLRGPRNLGWDDWDLSLAKYESVRRTVLEWGQFPWWDPWCRGGFPLAANPQCGVIGVATPLVLALGTSVGMRLAQLVCLLIAMEGGRRLAWLWFREPLAAVAAGLIFGINGAVLTQAVYGYHLPMSYCSFPWLLYYTFRLDRRRSDGALLGFWLAFNVLNGINYYNIYALTILAVVWLRALRARSGSGRSRLMVHTVLAVGVFFALAGWRIATTALVFRDFPRPYQTAHDFPLWEILIFLVSRPRGDVMISMENLEFRETLWYVGPVVLTLAILSLIRGWRWWHTLTAVSVWLAAGSVASYHPSYWLGHLPLYTSMHMVTRWRIMAMLGIAFAAADVLARWRRGASSVPRRLAAVAVVLIAADYCLLGCQLLHLGFSVEPSESRFPGAPTQVVVQVRDGSGFAAIQRGYGVIRLQEPLLGYDQRAPTARLWRGHPQYTGEFWTADGPLVPQFWSPNRIVLQAQPAQAVSINQNPGSWWLVNGRRVFSDSRCAETEREFSVCADATGRLELQIRPRGLELGLALHIAGSALVGLVVIGIWLKRPNDIPSEDRVNAGDPGPFDVADPRQRPTSV